MKTVKYKCILLPLCINTELKKTSTQMRHAALLKLVIRNNRPPPVQTWTCHTSSKYSQSHTTYTHQVWFTVHSMCTHTHTHTHILPSLLQEQIHKIRSPVHTMYTHLYAHMHSSTHTHTIPTPSESFTKFNHQSHSMYAHRMHTHTHTHTHNPHSSRSRFTRSYHQYT